MWDFLHKNAERINPFSVMIMNRESIKWLLLHGKSYTMSNRTLPESLAYNLVNGDADHAKTHLLILRHYFNSLKTPACKEIYEMIADKRLLLKFLNLAQFIILFRHPRNVILSLRFWFNYIENRNPTLLGKLSHSILLIPDMFIIAILFVWRLRSNVNQSLGVSSP